MVLLQGATGWRFLRGSPVPSPTGAVAEHARHAFWRRGGGRNQDLGRRIWCSGLRVWGLGLRD